MNFQDEEELVSADVTPSGRRWLKTATTLLLIISVKFFLLCLVPLGETNNFDFFLCLFEFIFRIAGLYFVKELLDDIAAEEVILTRAASVRSRKSVAAPADRSPPSPPPGMTRSTTIEIPLTDFMSNTTMKVTLNQTAHGHQDGGGHDSDADAGVVSTAAVVNTLQH